jgi:DNA-binding HxlR family transcriptional regulator
MVGMAQADDVSGDPATPLDEAVARVGDRWSLLLVNALLPGPRKFGELSDDLPGLAPNILTRRLRSLEQEGIVRAVLYQERPPRFAYQLTEAGNELAGALRLLAQWGAQRAGMGRGSSVQPLTHAACGTPVEARWYCPTCNEVVEPADPDDLRYA